MADEQQVGAIQLNALLRGVSPPVTHRLRLAEQHPESAGSRLREIDM
jgi:hypothetical protein